MRRFFGEFSWVELVILLAIFVMIAVIAIPGFISARVDSNQAAAVSALRTINRAELTYKMNYDQGFAPALPALGPSKTGKESSLAAGLIDSDLAEGTHSGYRFTYRQAGDGGYTINADPVTPGKTGDVHYFTDETDVIRENSSQPAGPADSPLGG